jgi:hypothetical protein
MDEAETIRQRVADLLAQRGEDLARLSVDILVKNHAYLHQYIKQAKPRWLPEDVRGKLAAHLGVDESEFKPAQSPKSGREISELVDRRLLALRDILTVPELEDVLQMGEKLAAARRARARPLPETTSSHSHRSR